MCGIAGWAGLSERLAARESHLQQMCDVIQHRGPDDWGTHINDRVALGMRRLSIIDVSGGRQPIDNEDGSCTIVFNGEIYNYRELRQGLEQRGHSFKTDSDTETILHRFEEVGADVVRDLNGMFGLAIWDERAQRLTLARDRLGIKPLYYWPVDGGVVFASELKSIMALPFFRAEVDPEAVGYYMSLGYIPDPWSIFEGVHKLPPGHLLTWSAETGVAVDAYWDPIGIEDASIDRESAVSEIRRLFDDSVQRRMIADVPLGAFLSGGLDSSTVVAHMARHSTQPVRTFSIGFEEPEFNEAPDAKVVADALGTDHTQLIVRPDVDELIDGVVAAFDEPFADSSAIPTFLVSKLAREHVTVSLSGDGGDELFGGYTRYQDTLRRSGQVPAPVGQLLAKVGRGLPHAAYGRNRLIDMARSFEARYAGMVALPLDPTEGGVGSEEIATEALSLERVLDPWFSRVPQGSDAHRMMSVDVLTYLPGDILTKVDRMSMAVSLEARVPLLDHRIVEFAATIPSSLKVKGDGKWIMREAVRDLLPDRVFQKSKQGFAVPLKPWFRKELHHRIEQLTEASSPLSRWIDAEAVRRVRREHEVGRRDHSHLLWRLLVLKLWLEKVSVR